VKKENPKTTKQSMKQKHQTYQTALAAVALLAATTMAHAYDAPAGGWGYIYDGSGGAAGSGGTAFDSLDGTWNHSGATGPGDSDNWDGSAIGGTLGPGNAPGGVQTGTDGSVNFLRIQDPGSPTAYAGSNNRTIAFGHNLSGVVNDSFLNTGVTLSFRARVPKTGMDDLLNGAAPITYPTTTGDGYGNFGNGLGAFYVKNSSGASGDGGVRPGAIGFSLATSFDTWNTTNSGPGLMMNNLNGDVLLNNVDSGEAGKVNMLPVTDPTVWNEFWITIVANDATPGNGTHTVSIWANGATDPVLFNVTGGNNNQDYQQMASMGMALANNTLSGAMDVDYFAVKDGVYAPMSVPEPTVMSFMGLGLLALVARYGRNRRG